MFRRFILINALVWSVISQVQAIDASLERAIVQEVTTNRALYGVTIKDNYAYAVAIDKE